MLCTNRYSLNIVNCHLLLRTAVYHYELLPTIENYHLLLWTTAYHWELPPTIVNCCLLLWTAAYYCDLMPTIVNCRLLLLTDAYYCSCTQCAVLRQVSRGSNGHLEMGGLHRVWCELLQAEYWPHATASRLAGWGNNTSLTKPAHHICGSDVITLTFEYLEVLASILQKTRHICSCFNNGFGLRCNQYLYKMVHLLFAAPPIIQDSNRIAQIFRQGCRPHPVICATPSSVRDDP